MNFGSPEVYLPRTFGTSLKDRHMQRVQRERGTGMGGRGGREERGTQIPVFQSIVTKGSQANSTVTPLLWDGAEIGEFLLILSLWNLAPALPPQKPQSHKKDRS